MGSALSAASPATRPPQKCGKSPAKQKTDSDGSPPSRHNPADSQGTNQQSQNQNLHDGNCSDLMSLEELAQALGKDVDISIDALRTLFDELDTDSDGLVSKEAFEHGLQQRPSASGFKAAMSLFHSAGIEEVLARHYTKLLQQRLRLPNDAEIELPTLLEHAQPDDLKTALARATDEIDARCAEQLGMLKEKKHATESATAFRDKFAFEADTFEFTYKGMGEFLDGVEGTLGLPGHDIYAGIAMEFCHSEDSHDEFKTSNYGGTTTTPAWEYNFVVNAAGGQHTSTRVPVPLQVFLYASSAQKANSDERYDTPLQQLSRGLRGAVKCVLVRRVLEAGLSTPVLASAAAHDSALSRLALLPPERLLELKAALAAAINNEEVLAGTGQPRYERVVAAVTGREGALVTAGELEALVEHMRRTLAGAGLTEEEIIALRLYTGPAYMKLNGTLRDRDNGRKGNRYVSAVFATISGMVKLAAASPVPAQRVVFRGQQGMRLPDCFWKPNSQADAMALHTRFRRFAHSFPQGVKGGVEMAFLSTTTDLQVAVDYAGAGDGVLPTVFAIRVGAVDKGAALGFLSQFPREEEILMPPRSFLEVIDEPSLLPTPRGPVLSIPVALNCNLRSPTLEKIRDSRKAMLVATLEHTRKEIARDLDALLASAELRRRAQLDIFWEEADASGVRYKDRLVQSVKGEGSALIAAVRARPAAWFRTDTNFKWAMKEALELKRLALGKLKLWLAARNLYVPYLSKISALDCDRKAVGRLVRLLEEGRRKQDRPAGGGGKHGKGGGWVGGVRDLALELCRHRELVSGDVEQRVGTSSDAETSLMREAAAGNTQAVELLLLAGADPDATRADGRTALMLAAQCGQTDTVRVLGRGGARANQADREGRSCIFYAAGNGHTETARVLVGECGADASTRSNSQWTAVIAAAYDGFTDTVELLVREGGVDANAVDGIGWTAVFYAAQNGHREVVAWLVAEGGCSADARDRRGRTAVMVAAQNGHRAVLQWLVTSGSADVNAEAERGWTAVKAARKARQWETLTWLVEEAGAVDDRRDGGGKLSLQRRESDAEGHSDHEEDDEMMALKVA